MLSTGGSARMGRKTSRSRTFWYTCRQLDELTDNTRIMLVVISLISQHRLNMIVISHFDPDKITMHNLHDAKSRAVSSLVYVWVLIVANGGICIVPVLQPGPSPCTHLRWKSPPRAGTAPPDVSAPATAPWTGPSAAPTTVNGTCLLYTSDAADD